MAYFPSIKSQYSLTKIPTFRTHIIDYGNKSEQRISLDSEPQYKIKLTLNQKNSIDADLITAFFVACKGKYQSFYLKAEDETTRSATHSTCTIYSLNQIRRPSTPNTHSYKCIQAGTTGTLSPTFATAANATFSDGGVIWRENSYLVRFSEDTINADYFMLNLYKFGIVEFTEVNA